MWRALHMAEEGSKEAVVKTAAAAPRAPALGVFCSLPKTPQQHSRACDGCQILLAQRLFSLPERKKHAYGRLWQQSKTSTSEDTQHRCKGQHCSPALPAPTAAPPRLGQLLAFLICNGSGPCQGTAAMQERERREKGPALMQHPYPPLSAWCCSRWC